MKLPRLVLTLLLASAPWAEVRADEPLAAVVKSDSLSLYANAVAAFRAEFKGEIVEYDLRDSSERAERIFARLADDKPNLVLALGPLAANAARKHLSDVPVVFALVPNYEKYGLEGKNVTGIALTRPSAAQLQTLKLLVPRAIRIGVVYTPRFSHSVVADAAAAARGAGVTLVQAKVEGPEEVPGAVRGIAERIDALWMIADRSVANVEAVKGLISLGLEQKLPVFALTDSQVKEGALVALSPNYASIGQQAGRLANRIAFEKVDPGALAVTMPEGLDIAINLSTAKRIGVECDLALEIFKFAAKNGYPIRVYE
ncbi:MAG: ABC transporter substrate-binding protein [Myxococcales bacterium]